MPLCAPVLLTHRYLEYLECPPDRNALLFQTLHQKQAIASTHYYFRIHSTTCTAFVLLSQAGRHRTSYKKTSFSSIFGRLKNDRDDSMIQEEVLRKRQDSQAHIHPWESVGTTHSAYHLKARREEEVLSRVVNLDLLQKDHA